MHCKEKTAYVAQACSSPTLRGGWVFSAFFFSAVAVLFHGQNTRTVTQITSTFTMVLGFCQTFHGVQIHAATSREF